MCFGSLIENAPQAEPIGRIQASTGIEKPVLLDVHNGHDRYDSLVLNVPVTRPEPRGLIGVQVQRGSRCQGVNDAGGLGTKAEFVELNVREGEVPIGGVTELGTGHIRPIRGRDAARVLMQLAVFVAGGHVWFPVESGWYRVESVSGLGCPLASDSLLVCWPVETPEVIQDAAGDLVIEGNFASVQWWADDMELEGETGLILTAPGEGNYSVWVTDFLDCPGVQSDAVVYVGVGEGEPDMTWSIHPNPVGKKFTLEVPQEWRGSLALLLDASGRILEERRGMGTTTQWRVDSRWPDVLFLRMLHPEGRGQRVIRVLRER